MLSKLLILVLVGATLAEEMEEPKSTLHVTHQSPEAIKGTFIHGGDQIVFDIQHPSFHLKDGNTDETIYKVQYKNAEDYKTNSEWPHHKLMQIGVKVFENGETIDLTKDEEDKAMNYMRLVPRLSYALGALNFESGSPENQLAFHIHKLARTVANRGRGDHLKPEHLTEARSSTGELLVRKGSTFSVPVASEDEEKIHNFQEELLEDALAVDDTDEDEELNRDDFKNSEFTTDIENSATEAQKGQRRRRRRRNPRRRRRRRRCARRRVLGACETRRRGGFNSPTAGCGCLENIYGGPCPCCGMCGQGCHCWDWVCPGSQDCGFNKGCFEHDVGSCACMADGQAGDNTIFCGDGSCASGAPCSSAALGQTAWEALTGQPGGNCCGGSCGSTPSQISFSNGIADNYVKKSWTGPSTIDNNGDGTATSSCDVGGTSGCEHSSC